MTREVDGGNPQKPKTGRSLVVRQAAARAAVTASKKTGRPVDERVQRLANSRCARRRYDGAVLRAPRTTATSGLAGRLRDR